MEVANVAQSERDFMGKIFAKRIVKLLVGVLVVAILAVAIVVIMPTETMHLRNTEFIERRISSDIAIPRESLEFVGGRFRRETIVVFQLQNDAIPVGNFSRFSSTQQQMEAAKRVSEVALACGVRITPLADDVMLGFQGADYSVICLNSTNVSYLVYLGAQ